MPSDPETTLENVDWKCPKCGQSGKVYNAHVKHIMEAYHNCSGNYQKLKELYGHLIGVDSDSGEAKIIDWAIKEIASLSSANLHWEMLYGKN
jgi:hypothetical protein